jgi:hypothetical protein
MSPSAGGGGGAPRYDYIQDAEPADPDLAERWLDTGTDPAEAYIYDGTGWVQTTTTDHDELGNVTDSDHHNPVTVGDGLTIDAAQALGLVVANALTFDGDGNLAVDESGISHNNISDVAAADHHEPVDVGDGLTVDAAQNLGLTVANALEFVNGDLAVDESGISHDNISGVSDSDHHDPVTVGAGLDMGAGQALSLALGNALGTSGGNLVVQEGDISHDNISGVSADDHHSQNHDNSDHTTNYLAQSDYDPEADTHSRYADSEARDALEGYTIVSPGGGRGSSLSFTKVGNSTEDSGEFGVTFEAQNRLAGVDVDINSNAENFDTLRIRDSNLNILYEDGSGWSGGDSVEIDILLEPGQVFAVTGEASFWQPGDAGSSFPYTSTDIDALGRYDTNSSDNYDPTASANLVTGIEALLPAEQEVLSII